MSIELEVGHKYSTEELAKALQVSYSNFKNKKNQFLKSLSMAYHYDVEYKGRATFYTITEKIGDYQKPARKNQRAKTDRVIQKYINDTIEEDPVQTAANINRRAWENAETHPSSVVLLGLKQSTTGEYIRLNLREMYGVWEGSGGTDGMIEKKIWCRLDAEYNCYIQMPPEMVKKLRECLNSASKGKTEFEENVNEAYEANAITEEERDKLLGGKGYNLHQEGKKLFRSKYGYWPIKVPVYAKCAWKNGDLAYAPAEFLNKNKNNNQEQNQ